MSDGNICSIRDGFVRAAVSVLSRNYDRTNRDVFSTEYGYQAQFRQTMSDMCVDRFRHLIRQRQRARMSGDLAEARRLRNIVNRAAPQLGPTSAVLPI